MRGGSGAGLPSSGRHLDQHLPSPGHDFATQPLDTLSLIGTAGNLAVRFDHDQVFLGLPGRRAPLQVRLRKDGLNLVWMCFALMVPEPDLLAVSEEDEWYAELDRVVARLFLGPKRVNGNALGF